MALHADEPTLVDYSDSSSDDSDPQAYECPKTPMAMPATTTFAPSSDTPLFSFGTTKTKAKNASARRTRPKPAAASTPPPFAFSTAAFPAAPAFSPMQPPPTGFTFPSTNHATPDEGVPMDTAEPVFVAAANPFAPDITPQQRSSKKTKKAAFVRSSSSPSPVINPFATPQADTTFVVPPAASQPAPSPIQSPGMGRQGCQPAPQPATAPHTTAAPIDDAFVHQFQAFNVHEPQPNGGDCEYIRLCEVHRLDARTQPHAPLLVHCSCCQQPLRTVFVDLHLCAPRELFESPWETPPPAPGFSFGTAPKPSSTTKGAKRRVPRSKRASAPAPAPVPEPPTPPPIEPDWIQCKRDGGAAYQRKDYLQAVQCYTRGVHSLSLEPAFDRVMAEHAKMLANRAAAWMMLHKIREALQDAEAAIALDSTYLRAHLRYGRCHLLVGDHARARNAYLGVYKLLPHASAADQTLYKPQVDLAIRDVEAFVSALHEAKWCLDVLETAKALQHTTSALTYAPYSRDLVLQKMNALVALKRFSDAVAYAKHQLHLHATIVALGVDFGLQYARSLHYLDEVEPAEHVLRQLEEAAPTSKYVLKLKQLWLDMAQAKAMGNDAFACGNYQRAINFYSAGLGLDADHDLYNAVLFCNRAAALMGLAKWTPAIADCKDALSRKPTYSRALLRKARCYVSLLRFKDGIADLRAYMEAVDETATEEERAALATELRAAQAKAAAHEYEQQERARAKQRKERQKQEQSRRGHDPYNDYFDSNKSKKGGRSSQNRQQPHKAPPVPVRVRSHYEVLHVPLTATASEIKISYRKLALKHHPDKAKSEADALLFKDMTAAYAVLSDAHEKAKYDRELRYGGYGVYYEY
ncbi:hypothetical protein SPRG_06105 [Saprolegnia parasitica CBS 223.65]|uniref:J domain-containing protein n=1 Tax=Saprolegnia parasitica (strain CBS 223.65) TaxID=695850 RepID=A0A067CIN7_SAPPC|nr:hypothetical protein SPRG_06105 [Saprolegnia parasitica CBS 223.65]KDO29050.1 hypothetical protein SPRG_06105 [Saprolegnia parasitica CBS 223.65]|eukprot:XP_012200220.1 hypothetical protein SPRG_06105 [Saprolegnia parasitica CBS 223.65]